ncbi:MAG: UTP--glucose-1-phosphate uridylyltransferase [Opitutales bacterium]|nr:UTP--glucose-1-phosphate uridylyltransferase [Opitutales bacterium]
MNTSRPIRKAVLPAAGFGTRFLPITKAIPKEMLPVGDKPVIHYVVEEAVAAGCTDILLVVSRDKASIQDYFDRAPELEGRLRAAGKEAQADELVRIASQARFHYVRQPEMKGLGDAVWQARDHVGDEPFALLLADTLIVDRAHQPGRGDAVAALMAAYAQTGHSAVAVEPVAAERIHRYGVVGGREEAEGRFALNCMVEKPGPAEAPRILRLNGRPDPGGWAFAARYLFTPRIFAHLARTQPGKNGEIQLTDAMAALMAEEGFAGCRLPGRRLDIGDAAGLLEANHLLAGR